MPPETRCSTLNINVGPWQSRTFLYPLIPLRAAKPPQRPFAACGPFSRRVRGDAPRQISRENARQKFARLPRPFHDLKAGPEPHGRS
jgi:hypothetical protein